MPLPGPGLLPGPGVLPGGSVSPLFLASPYQIELYASLGPANTLSDEQYGWGLLDYCGAIASMFDPVELYARALPSGEPGWAWLLDPDLVGQYAPELLPWLGQFVGVRVNTTLSVDLQVDQVKSTGGFNRGKPAAIIAAGTRRLTGSQYFLFKERVNGDAYVIDFFTLTSETPTPDLTLQDLLEEKPAGIILNYATVSGQTYDTVDVSYAAYTNVTSHYSTYESVILDLP